MPIFLLLALFAGFTLGQVEVPCYGEGCVNITVYLGPKWGSRVVMVPRTKTTPPGIEEYRPQQRPVPADGDFQVDLDGESPSDVDTFKITEAERKSTILDDDQSKIAAQYTRKPYDLWPLRGTLPRPSQYGNGSTNSTVHVKFDVYGRGTVDLSWRSYSGETVKRVLMSLPKSDLSRVETLVLDSNHIQQLPVLTFPVELEYSLQQLSLSYNFFYPTYLTSYTRFELSRLARLKTLNMTWCSLDSFETPDLPALEVLDLSNNMLSVIPPDLGRLENLNQLLLRNNRISYIYESSLSTSSNLWVLDLGRNDLWEIDGEPLRNLRNLVTVKLDNNNLRSMPLLDSESTKIVYFGNNHLLCTCDLMDWINFPNRQLHFEYYDSCQVPGTQHDFIPLHELRTSPGKHRRLCYDSWWSRARLVLERWVQDREAVLLTFKVVGVATVVMLLVVLLKKLQKLKTRTKAGNIPYNVLDEQQVSTVYGPHVDV